MTRYNVYIVAEDGDEASTWFDVDEAKVAEVREGLPTDNYSFSVIEVTKESYTENDVEKFRMVEGDEIFRTEEGLVTIDKYELIETTIAEEPEPTEPED
jgi:hypothetical protein